MNSQKKIKIEMLYGYLTELHEDIKKFREGCTSDIYDSLSLSLEFECMGLLGRLDRMNIVAPIISEKRIQEVQSAYRKLACEQAQLENEYISWKGTGSVKSKKKTTTTTSN